MLCLRVGTNRGELRIFDSREDLTSDLAEHIYQLSETSIKERGVFTIAFSSGSSVGLLEKLSKTPYDRIIEWRKVHIFWADKRVVPKYDAQSNYKLEWDELLSKKLIYPKVYSIKDSLPADKAAKAYESKIRELVRTHVIDALVMSDCPKFDLIVLEMGPDGDIASLFPDHPVLNADKEVWVTSINDCPTPPPKRITFTLQVINSASNVAIVATGGDKAEAVHLAIDGPSSGPTTPPERMVEPIKEKAEAGHMAIDGPSSGPTSLPAMMVEKSDMVAAGGEKAEAVQLAIDRPSSRPTLLLSRMFESIEGESDMVATPKGAEKAEAALQLAIDGPSLGPTSLAAGMDEPSKGQLAIDGSSSGPTSSPARMVAPIRGRLVWFFDTEAASELDDVLV